MVKTQKSINYELERNKNHNVGIMILIAVVLLGYVFFFMSPLIFHERPVKQLTELVTEHQFFNGTISVRNWDYSPEQKMFKVRCEFSDNIILENLEVSSTCNFTYKTKKVQELSAEIGYYTTNYLVVYIEEVPEDWYCASLRITNNSEYIDVESTLSTDSQTEKKDVAAQLDDNLKTGSIYTCVENVDYVSKINVFENENEFVVERAKGNISINNDLIEKNKESIKQYERSIEECDKNIKTLENERTFQVEVEVKATNDKITTLKNQIDTIQRKIKELETENFALNSEIEEYEEIIAEFELDATEKTQSTTIESTVSQPTTTINNPTQPNTTQKTQSTTQRSR